jgi:hypothetical protein
VTYYLPRKVHGYLRRLAVQYERSGKHLENELITGARIFVDEATSYDNWNGGTYGHTVILFLPLEALGKVDIDRQSDVCSGITDDLRKLGVGIENEGFDGVRLEATDEDDPEFQQSVPFSSDQPVRPESLSIWKPGLVRLFISHRDIHKRAARALADELEGYGLSCFVAHDTIEPRSEWRREILKGLQTMEAMLVFLTDDFAESTWTNQEVGYALGKNVPVISLKLGDKDPPGFISHEQALRARLGDHPTSAKKLYPIIGQAIGREKRMQDALIQAFVNAPNFNEAKDRFEQLAETVNQLTEDQVATISEGFATNSQLYGCFYLTRYDRLTLFLDRATGKRSTISQNKIVEIKQKRNLQKVLDDDIPF